MPKRAIDLDFVRGTAILLALGWHFNQSGTGMVFVDWLLIPGSQIGWAGVDLFFVLSGFLIGGMIFREVRETGSFRVGRFLVRRALKIWPVLYGYLILLLLVQRYPWQDFMLQNAFHVQNFFRTPLSHLWSLAIEEHYYLLLPALVVVVVRKGLAGSKLVPIVLAATFAACLVARCLAFVGDVDDVSIQWQTQYRIDALSAGAVLAWLRTYRPETFAAMARPKLALAVVWLTGAVLLSLPFDDPVYKQTLRYTVAYVAAAAFLLFCLGARPLVAAPFWARAVAKIGFYSYAMYVYQFVAYRAVESLMARSGLHHVPAAVEIGTKYIGAFLVGYVVTKLLERPALAMRDRLIPPSTAETRLTAP